MKVKDLLYSVSRRLEKEKVSEALLNAEHLTSSACGFERKDLFLRLDEEVPPGASDWLKKALSLKIKGFPLSWILGNHDFCGLRIKIKTGVFTPRPETEELAQIVLAESLSLNKPRILDFCCGSGCISLFIANKNPQARILSIDISSRAVSCARNNVSLLGLKNMKVIKKGSLPSKGKFDILVCNPPYIPESFLPNLDPEVRCEPRRALDGGEDGLDMIRYIEKKARFLLRKGGKIYLEFGSGQGDEIKNIFSSQYVKVFLRRDLQGKDRFLEAVNG